MSDLMPRLNAALQGRYVAERQLGEGGMATVYLADDLKHGRKVALKVLKPELAAVVGGERFLTEIRTTANLQHPNILPLFDSGSADGFLFYVMPHVEGESLRDRLDREHQLPVEDAVRIATGVAEALDYAHARGVIHRDIKPANILLPSGKPVIADFGIALAVKAGGENRLTETGLSLGTPHYMSPEQATGDARVGAATDVYALGCVLYEMLVGEPPYVGSTPQAILGRIIAGELASATKQRASVPAHVDAVIRKALEKVPADRFTTAGELASALADRGFRHGDAGVSVASRRAPAWRVALVGVIAGALVGVAGTAARLGGPSATDGSVVRFALPTTGRDSLDSSTTGQDVAISPDGRKIAYVGRTEDGSTTQIWIRSIDVLEAMPLRGSEGGENPIFSPDGALVGFVDSADPRTLKSVPVSGGNAVTVAALPSSVLYIAGVAWGEDDGIFLGTGSTGGIYRVGVAGGEPERLTEGQHHWPSIIEGRDAVLLMDHARGTELAVLDLRSGEVKPLGVAGTSPRFLPTGHLLYADGDGFLWAVRFDVASLEVLGEPVLLADGVEVKLINEGGANFAVSEDGHLAYALGPPNSAFSAKLVAVARDGTRSVLADIDGVGWYPRYSPDGARVGFGQSDVHNAGSESDLWVLDVQRGARTRITFGGNNRFVPLWSRDGARISYSTSAGATNQVVSASADGTGSPDTLTALADRHFATSWSPDGSTLAYFVDPPDASAPSRGLWARRTDGPNTTPVRLAESRDWNRGPVFSPNGRWVAYVSDRSGVDEVYARPYPGPGQELTLSVGGGDEPVWGPSGREIFYRRAGELVSVSLDSSGSSLTPGAPTVVFSDPYARDTGGSQGGMPNYDVAPDGNGFVMLEQTTSGVSAAANRLEVVLNWLEEQRATLPN
jgi:serine/threonine protein kinase